MADAKRYTAVVIGCGQVGATYEITTQLPKPASHAAALIASPRTELIALVDADTARLKQAGEYYHVPMFADSKECLEKRHPDIVVIATPPDTHEELLALALSMKARAVLCEKPMADTLESAKRMITLAQDADATVVLNYQRRFFPLFRAARERIAKGELGDIQQATIYYANGLSNNASHLLNALEFLIDDTVAWASGVQNEKNTVAPFGSNIDGLCRFSRGTIAAVQTFDNNSYGIHDLILFGTKGALKITQFGYSFEWVRVRDGVTFGGMRELDWKGAECAFDKRSMVQDVLGHVVSCVDGAHPPQSTLADGYRTMQILDALTQSANEQGKRMYIR